MSTEDRNPRSADLDQLSVAEVVELMDVEEQRTLSAVAAAAGAIADAAEQVAHAVRSGGRVFLVGAGTSGRLAVQEVAELPPTFGVPDGQFVALVAGGPSGGPAVVAPSEDDTTLIREALAGSSFTSDDLLLGLAASGTTPFVLAAIDYACSVGAWTCGIANRPNTPLLTRADLGVLIDTGPEILTGSTRLKAGTAQKLVLNRITTAAMVAVGRVLSNHMVALRPANDKLRRRCIRIVEDLAAVSAVEAVELLDVSDWDIRTAVHLGSRALGGTPQ